jgi:hypothetical protein
VLVARSGLVPGVRMKAVFLESGSPRRAFRTGLLRRLFADIKQPPRPCGFLDFCNGGTPPGTAVIAAPKV